MKKLVISVIIPVLIGGLFGYPSVAFSENQEARSWCRRGDPILRTISQTKKELEEINSQSDDSGVAEWKKERMDSIMSKLRDAESALDALDDEARAKGVPPGWIRCNFE